MEHALDLEGLPGFRRMGREALVSSRPWDYVGVVMSTPPKTHRWTRERYERVVQLGGFEPDQRL